MIVEMNRRSFLKSSVAATVALTATPSLLFIEGCSVNVIELLNVVLDSAQSILIVAEPGASWVSDFTKAIAALKQAETSWQNGSDVQIVISALNTLEAVVAVVPIASAYSPLIDVLVTGIEAVLVVIMPKAPSASGAPVAAMARAHAPNPHRGRVTLVGKPSVQNYKKLFNETAKAAGFPQAELT